MRPQGIQIVAEFIYCSKGVLDNKDLLEGVLRNGIEECGLKLVGVSGHKFNPVGATIIAVIEESHIAIHTYPEARHASIDIFTCSTDSQPQISRLLNFLKVRLRPKTTRVVELLRGNPLQIIEDDWKTSFSATGFDTRYHINKRILSKRSGFQQIDIIENENFGRMLFLDNDLQIAESDAHIYNQNMVLPLIEGGIKLHEVAILGGGDGGVLHELLRYNPKVVYLVDIDEEVIKASKRYLRRICKNSFGDPRVRVVVDDANRFLVKRPGLDAVIYDLTTHPESLTNKDRRIFFNELFMGIKNALNEKGMVSLQCCSEFDKESLKILRTTLSRYFTDLHFSSSFIPSFCENWIFASARAGP